MLRGKPSGPVLAWQLVILINGMMEIEDFRVPRALLEIVLAGLMALLLGAGCAGLGYIGIESVGTLNK